MEEIFSDALGLLGAEAWEDDGYVHYGGLKLGIVPKVRFQKQKKNGIVVFDRLIVDIQM